jgi:hypothetical protein
MGEEKDRWEGGGWVGATPTRILPPTAHPRR